MATKKAETAKKVTRVGKRQSTTPRAEGVAASEPKYASIGDVMRAAAKGAIPRGAKFVISNGRARFGVGMQTLLDVDASEVARWGLRKAGFKADHAA